ncbi:hypothetical protein WICPIJ_008022 [Wickerhamomyces pijperi]|uniref:Uncharacterized protein n=1 Tax=Wickerhamomyces pijperi TaxID=599730 RepID=A0A9P8Q1F1_WICPI|nr:hypothetical protein WICPIJ_008022 [Wickerhamomyces pijperi]
MKDLSWVTEEEVESMVIWYFFFKSLTILVNSDLVTFKLTTLEMLKASWMFLERATPERTFFGAEAAGEVTDDGTVAEGPHKDGETAAEAAPPPRAGKASSSEMAGGGP